VPRPEIKALKYFPFDVGFFGDRKIRLLRGQHGADGVEVYMRLLIKCYASENGYYYLWKPDEDYALLAEDTGFSEEKVRLIVSTCIGRSLFDDTLYGMGNVLSSRGIQRRYFLAVREAKYRAAARNERHTLIPKDICLLTEEDFFEINKPDVWLRVADEGGLSRINPSKSRINPSKSRINPTNEMKRNEMKRDERKHHDDDDAPAAAPLCEGGAEGRGDAGVEFPAVASRYMDIIGSVPPPRISAAIQGYLDCMDAAVVMDALDRAEAENKRSWSYAEGILRRHKAGGIRNMADVAHADKEFRRRAGDGEKRGARGKPPTVNVYAEMLKEALAKEALEKGVVKVD
jgi:hypothetical protein